MAVQIATIRKIFVDFIAIDPLTFDVESGSLLSFLGLSGVMSSD
ncbi:MAG: hypothetical protein ACK6AD_03100 [Cyanobacteriota bacterium]|jgi:ABC-type uncharacterized transport system ATPase subunit